MKSYFKPITIIILLAGLTLPAGCGFNPTRSGEITAPAPPVKAGIEEVYPASPEEVVIFFIDAYSADTVDGMRFLSPGLTATLNEESASHLLPISGLPDAYNLQEGATSLEMQTSKILVEMVYGSATYWVEFGLTQTDGKWMIDRIGSG